MIPAARFALIAWMLAIACSSASGEPPAVVSAVPAPDWTAKFNRTEGWIGADAAYSVPLSPTRTLWLFGDTWVGAVKNGSRAGSTMVNNSIAIQEGHGLEAKFAFPILREPEGKARSYFRPDSGSGYYWPLGGAVADRKLVVVLTRIESTAKGGPFGFRLTGQALAVVKNPTDDPANWQVDQIPLTHAEFTAERTRTFGSAVLAAGGFLYFYGIDEPARAGFGGKRLILARVPEAKVTDLAAWEFRRDGRWQADAGALDVLATGIANECSVSYLPHFKQYALVYTEIGLSDRLVARFAPAPEGPWSKPVLLYTCPEMKADKGVFTYAGKAHAHLAKVNELIVSYCVNAHDFWRVARDASIYRPVFVRVELK